MKWNNVGLVLKALLPFKLKQRSSSQDFNVWIVLKELNLFFNPIIRTIVI